MLLILLASSLSKQLLTCTLLCLVNFSFSSLHFNSMWNQGPCKWSSCYLKGNHGNHSSFVWDMFQEHKFCFTMEVISKQGLQKPFVTVCSTYFTILKTESGLFDKFVGQVSQSVKLIIFLHSTLETQELILETRFSKVFLIK